MEVAASALDGALVALDRGDEPGAMAVMLAAWRAAPSPSLAEAIDRLDEQLRARRPPLKRSLAVAAREMEWARIAAERRPEDLGWLLAQPWPGKWEGALARLEILVKHERDPRLARHLARVVDELPFDSWASFRFYRVALLYLERCGDARALEALERPSRRRRHNYETRYQAWVTDTAQKLRASAAAVVPVDDPALVALRARLHLDRAASGGAPRTEADAGELLAAIAAAPDDDGPRQVYADLLLEAGDPRGEFIALQLARARGERVKAAALRREKELLAAHRDAWVGPLRELVNDDGVRFTRGFIDGVALASNDRVEAQGLPEHAVWRTVRTLDLAALNNRVGPLVIDRITPTLFPSLREIIGLGRGDSARLLERADPPPLTGLSLKVPDAPHDGLARFSRLRWLGMDEPQAWVASTPIWARLEELYVSAASLGRWWELVTTHPSAIRRVRLGYFPPRLGPNVRWEYDLERDDDGRFSRLTIRWLPCGRACTIDFGLAEELRSLPADALTSLVIEPSRSIQLWGDYPAHIEAAAARFTRVASPSLPWR